jgi:oligosaccharide amylase
MGVHLPTGAVGNGRVLCTVGGAGEIMGFFYPRIDFAQNVRQCLPAVYLGQPGHGRLLWTFDGEFERAQHYEPDANVLVTRLALASHGLELQFRDCCPPGSDALVRRVTVRATGAAGFEGSVLCYWELRLQEVTGKQSVRYMPEHGAVLQYFRDTAIAVGGRRPDLWRCGKSIDEGPRSAKSDLFDGHLNGQQEDIGQVDFALGWGVDLEPGGAMEFDVIIAAGAGREQALAALGALAAAGAKDLERRTREHDAAWLDQMERPAVAEHWRGPYQRALLALRMLQDVRTRAVIAAPEFDPSYEACGGYGYCWPRDATEAVMALLLAGDAQPLRGLNDWYAKSQLVSGHWGQRYWCEGILASSWSLREDFLQVDQTAAAVIALCAEAAGRTGATDTLAERWPSIRRGADALAEMVGGEGWHTFACDLWETYCGTFVYTNAAIYAALRDAAEVAGLTGDGARADAWQGLCRGMKAAVVALHNSEYLPRGVLADGRPDLAVDSSTLGVSEPFGLLSVSAPEERHLIETNLATIEERLQYTMPDGRTGIRRYEGDAYLGGVIGCVNTLWFALVTLQVANSYEQEDALRGGELRTKAEGYLEFCLAHATPTGLLPELIGIYPEYPYWAAPHSWASGLMVKCLLELGQTGVAQR